MKHHKRTAVFLLLSLTLLLTAAPALADDHASAGQGHEHHFFAGAKLSYLAAFAHGETHHLYGAGVFFETTLISHWLEMEFAVKVMKAHHAIAVPMDILFKVPFHLNDWIHPFVGLGPTLVIAVHDDKGAEPFFGLATAAGAYFWLSKSIAVSGELNYNIVNEHGAAHEIGFSAGVVFGW